MHHGKFNRQNRNKIGEDRQRKLTANHQQFNWIKQLIGLEWNSFYWSEQYQKKIAKNDIFLTFSLLFNNWLFQTKWRVAKHKSLVPWWHKQQKGWRWRVFCIRIYFRIQFLLMFMTSLRGEPIRGQQNCPIATIWCKIKWVLTKNSLFIQFFPSKQFWTCFFCFNHYLLVTPLHPRISCVFNAQI